MYWKMYADYRKEHIITTGMCTPRLAEIAHCEIRNLHPGVMVIGIIGLALLIWIIGSMIDWVRKGISKILRVDKLSLRIEQMIPERFKF